MGSEFHQYKVSEFSEAVGGGTPKTKVSRYWNGSIPWLTPKDLSNHQGRFVSKGARSISHEGLQNSSARMLPKRTVLLTSRAPVGYVAIAKYELCTNQGFRNLVVKDGFSPEFIYYLLVQNVDYLKQHASGSRFQELSGSTLKNLIFKIPPLPEQLAIAHILGSLDDKIELNRRMNDTLEKMAQAIFKSWFIDFNPVHAKAEGRDSGLPDEIATLFPDSFEDSELGQIPKGWEALTVKAGFDVTMGQSPPGSTYNENGNGLPFFQERRDFGFRYPTKRVYCTEPKRLANLGDTLISVRAPVGDINMAYEHCCIGRGVAAVRHKSGSRSFTYYSMRALGERFSRFEGEGTVFGSINKKQLDALPYVAPLAGIIEAFENQVGKFDENVRTNTEEIRTLALLPKLISGERRVPDAEELLNGLNIHGGQHG